MAAERADLASVLAAFGHVLHQAGVPVTPERSARFARAVLLAQPSSLPELAALGRTTLLSTRDQIEVFDRVFGQVFRGLIDYADFRSDSAQPAPRPPSPATTARPARASARARASRARAAPRGSRRTPRASPTRTPRRRCSPR
ncbi:MAG: hypothetical protein U0S36_10715 [Candidatus Nanopelagicales bacterium]